MAMNEFIAKVRPRRFWAGVTLAAVACGVLLISGSMQGEEKMKTPDWRAKLAAELPVFGHRNWIVVADAAYPAQSGQGIETLYAGGDHAAVVAEVLRAVDAAEHVAPVVFIDEELQYVADADAPGIEQFRTELGRLLEGQTAQRLAHEDIIRQLDEAGKLYRVLIIKTDMRLPYTSVFVQLDCGYWGPEKERRLRETISAARADR